MTVTIENNIPDSMQRWEAWETAYKMGITNVRDMVVYKIFMKQWEQAIEAHDIRMARDVVKAIEACMDYNVPPQEKKYEQVPPFDLAVMDCLRLMYKDLDKIPDLEDYYANAVVEGQGDGVRLQERWAQRIDNKRDSRHLEALVKKAMVLVSADTQSGKSSFIIRSMLTNKTPIIVLRNLYGDSEQLQRGIATKVDQIIKYLANNKVVNHRITLSDRVITGDSLTTKRVQEQLDRSLQGSDLHMMVCLANETQLGRVIEAVKEYPMMYTLIIDEMDYVDYGVDKKGVMCGTAQALITLKEFAHQTFAVTTTPLDVIFSEKELRVANQLCLTPPEDYRGFYDILVKPLDHEVSALNKKATYEEQLAHDPNMKKFLDYFAKLGPDFSWATKEYIPNLCLFKNTRFIENQVNLAQGINRDYPTIPTLVYNESGVMMTYRGMEEVKVAGVTMKSGEFAQVSIADALQHLHDNGGVKRFPRIIVISGDLAGRGISYVTKNYRWHTTDMYYIPAATTPIAEIIQSTGRLWTQQGGCRTCTCTHRPRWLTPFTLASTSLTR